MSFYLLYHTEVYMLVLSCLATLVIPNHITVEEAQGSPGLVQAEVTH